MNDLMEGKNGIILYNKNGKSVSLCGDYVATGENDFVDRELRKDNPFGWVTLLDVHTGEKISRWRAQNSDIFIVKLFKSDKCIH